MLSTGEHSAEEASGCPRFLIGYFWTRGIRAPDTKVAIGIVSFLDFSLAQAPSLLVWSDVHF
jgi:hypothetical protein